MMDASGQVGQTVTLPLKPCRTKGNLPMSDGLQIHWYQYPCWPLRNKAYCQNSQNPVSCPMFHEVENIPSSEAQSRQLDLRKGTRSKPIARSVTIRSTFEWVYQNLFTKHRIHEIQDEKICWWREWAHQVVQNLKNLCVIYKNVQFQVVHKVNQKCWSQTTTVMLFSPEITTEFSWKMGLWISSFSQQQQGNLCCRAVQKIFLWGLSDGSWVSFTISSAAWPKRF